MFRDVSLQEHFEQHGFVQVELLDDSEIRELRDAWERLDGGMRHLPFSLTLMSSDAAYRRRVHEATTAVLSKPIERYLQGHRLLQGLFINKALKQGMGILAPHQDWSLVDEHSHLSIGIWCPLVDVDIFNGCMVVVPGSHRLHTRPRATSGKLPLFDVERLLPVIGSYAVPLPMRAGQALLHMHSLFHGSGPNLLPANRPVVATAAIPAHAELQLYTEVQEGDRVELRIHVASLEVMLDFCMDEGVVKGGTEFCRIPFETVGLTEERTHEVLAAARAAWAGAPPPPLRLASVQ